MDAAIHYIQGLIHEQIGAPAAAEEAFSRAIYLERDFALAHFHSGLCRARRGDHRAARRSLSNVARILDGREAGSTVAQGDGLTVEELRELTRLQTTALRRQ
jgi:chemotaxis protein methyltransferase CheR